MTKIAGSGSRIRIRGSISKRHGSANPDPDPHQKCHGSAILARTRMLLTMSLTRLKQRVEFFTYFTQFTSSWGGGGGGLSLASRVPQYNGGRCQNYWTIYHLALTSTAILPPFLLPLIYIDSRHLSL
jgi:hypothetical protein